MWPRVTICPWVTITLKDHEWPYITLSDHEWPWPWETMSDHEWPWPWETMSDHIWPWVMAWQPVKDQDRGCVTTSDLVKKWWTYSNFSDTVSSGLTMYSRREADMMAPLFTWQGIMQLRESVIQKLQVYMDHTGIIQVSYRYHTVITGIQVSYRYHTGIIQISYRYHTVIAGIQVS